MLSKEIEQLIKQEADKWVFETNGHKWSNNDSSAGDNFSSYQAGATKWALEAEYWKKRCEAAENLLSVMIVPNILSEPDNTYSLFLDRDQEWQKSKWR